MYWLTKKAFTMINRYEFEVLKYLNKKKNGLFHLRDAADSLRISFHAINQSIDSLCKKGMLISDNNKLEMTEKGYLELEKFRVRKAIILAAGFGSRMMPATKDRPKPMVEVNGVRIIDTLLDALLKEGIEEIIIVGGYRFDKLCELKSKYPTISFFENTAYETTNNISSIVLALDELKGGCYICEADLFISNPSIISKYHYQSDILGSYSIETDDWSYKMKDGCVSDYQKGNTFCYNYYGISYWTKDDCDKLRQDFCEIFNSEGGKEYFWEFVPFVLRKDKYQVEIIPCDKRDIIEIDNYYELCELDNSYK